MAVLQELKERVYQWAAAADQRIIPRELFDQRKSLGGRSDFESEHAQTEVLAASLVFGFSDLDPLDPPHDLWELTGTLQAGFNQSLWSLGIDQATIRRFLKPGSFDDTLLHEYEHWVPLPESVQVESFISVSLLSETTRKGVGYDFVARCMSPYSGSPATEAVSFSAPHRLGESDALGALAFASKHVERGGNTELYDLIEAIVRKKWKK